MTDISGGVVMSVASKGEVVPTQERDRLFTRGFRASTAQRPGTGLGLYVAQIIAEAHRATIAYSADTDNGDGTNEFSLTLPAHSQ